MTSRTKTKHRDNAQKDPAAFAKACALILASGLLISIYSVVLRQAALHAGSQDLVRSAATFVANDLRKIAVVDSSFGAVGLCDATIEEGNARTRLTSLNRLYATLRLDDIVSKQLQLNEMSRMVASDFDQLRRVEEELRQKLNERAKQLYERAYRMAAQSNRANEKLVAMRIRLGYEDSHAYQSGMPAIATQGEQVANKWTVNGKYAAGVDVPISGGGMAQFYQLASENKFVDASKFREAKSGMTPSVVLVEAEYDVPTRRASGRERITRTAAIMLGGIDTTSPTSVMVVGFPQGMPKPLHSLRALVSASTAGTFAWQQASDGTVPGQGHFAQANYRFDGTPDMTGKEAVQVGFYHWLRSLGPHLNLASVAKMFDSSWAVAEVRSLDTTSQRSPFPAGPNSALTKDTGARTRAFFFQSGPGGDGQRVLKTAFEALPNQQALPNSAVPLDIDDTGNCNVPGHSGFDRKLVADLLQAVYDTNVAANESLGLAKSIINRLERAEDQIQTSIDIANEELRSIGTQRKRAPNAAEPTPEIKRIQSSEAELTAQIESQKAKLQEYKKVRARAQLVSTNAESAAQASFDLCANMLNYAGEGLFRAHDGSSFLLGGVYIFHPMPHSVTEDEIYKGNDSVWTRQSFNALEAAPEREALESKVERNQSASSEENRAMPRFAIFDSRELTGNNPHLLVLDRSPFSDTGVPVGQLSYYAPNALVTGDNPPVGWSLLVRDVIANRAMGGDPLRSRFSQWCLGESRAVSECPGIAVEIQVRSPAPIIPELPVGSFVVSPQNHDRVSQIPPTPPDML